MSEEYPIKNGLPSLAHLARLKCIQNAHHINDVGTTPYHLIEPVLKKKTAKSLMKIEDKSPQIIIDSEPLWKSLIMRDFADKRSYFQLEKNNNLSSRDLYYKYTKDLDEQKKQVTSQFKQLTKNLKERKSKVTAVNHVIVPTRRNLPKFTNNKQSIFKNSMIEKARLSNKKRSQNFKSISTPVVKSSTGTATATSSSNKINSITPITPVQLSKLKSLSKSNSRISTIETNGLRRLGKSQSLTKLSKFSDGGNKGNDQIVGSNNSIANKRTNPSLQLAHQAKRARISLNSSSLVKENNLQRAKKRDAFLNKT
ncbi:hypothetical protein DAMA08_052000 [Martiniozyma asiatica (nom. inval.)]|nr:hypothetical protein DAMA08_052000 [Martiniozyma asiatica]